MSDNNIGIEMARGLVDAWNLMVNQSTPEQRGKWIRDYATTAFKGTPAKPELFLATHQRRLPLRQDRTALTPMEVAMQSPEGFNQVVLLINEAKDAVLDADNATKRLKGFVL